MAKYEAILTDGRIVHVNSDEERHVAHQAEHWDRDRFVMNVRRDQDPGPSPAKVAVVNKIED